MYVNVQTITLCCLNGMFGAWGIAIPNGDHGICFLNHFLISDQTSSLAMLIPFCGIVFYRDVVHPCPGSTKGISTPSITTQHDGWCNARGTNTHEHCGSGCIPTPTDNDSHHVIQGEPQKTWEKATPRPTTDHAKTPIMRSDIGTPYASYTVNPMEIGLDFLEKTSRRILIQFRHNILTL